MSELKITKVESLLTQPCGARLAIVRVETSEPGLYGLGCATFTQRCSAVKTAIDQYVGPFVVGKDPGRIEDHWQQLNVNAFWRNGPVLNNAISGVDMALWDIKGKLAGMPCHDLWGGRCRTGAAVYVHAGGPTLEACLRSVQKHMEQGFRFIRCQIGGYPGVPGDITPPDGSPPGQYYDPRKKMRDVPRLFEYLRSELPEDIELLHDIHERLAPIDAVWLAKALEPYRLFFLEDILAPEDNDWFRQVRAQCATPLAMGELFNNPREIVPLVSERLIDFVRVHVSQIGGVTPALKLSRLCEAFGVRTAWHGPRDVSPVGMAANVHLDVAVPNFGVQEWVARHEIEYDMFPGTPRPENGYVYPNDRPGLGIEFDETLAAKYPIKDGNPDWTEARLPDGSPARP